MYISVFSELDLTVLRFVHLLFMYSDYDSWCNFHLDNVQTVLTFLYNYEESKFFDKTSLKSIDLHCLNSGHVPHRRSLHLFSISANLFIFDILWKKTTYSITGYFTITWSPVTFKGVTACIPPPPPRARTWDRIGSPDCFNKYKCKVQITASAPIQGLALRM